MKSFQIVLKAILDNHVFVFDQKLYKQNKGGAIGVSLAGDIANLFMVWWDRQLKTRLAEIDMNLLYYFGKNMSKILVFEAIQPLP